MNESFAEQDIIFELGNYTKLAKNFIRTLRI